MNRLAQNGNMSQEVSADEIIRRLRNFGVHVSYPNMQRMRRAYDLFENHQVEWVGHCDKGRHFRVASQSETGLHYDVYAPSVDQQVPVSEYKCNCMDMPKDRLENACKHAMAARIYEESDRIWDRLLEVCVQLEAACDSITRDMRGIRE